MHATTPKHHSTPSSPGTTWWLASTVGVLAGVGGLTHAAGELLQGGARPAGVVFDSWTTEPIATNLGGEPAMTLLPDLRVTGLVTAVVSIVVLVWAATGVRRPRYGWILLVASVAMLLVGGGFGPPLLGILAGLASVAAWRHRNRPTRLLSGPLGRALSMLWPWSGWAVLADVAFLVAGSIVLAAWFDVNAPEVFVYALFGAVAGFPIAILAGMADDARRRPATAAFRAGVYSAAAVVVVLGVAYLLHAAAPPNATTPARDAQAQPASAAPASAPARTVTVLGAGDVLLHSPLWRQAAADAAAVGGSGYDFGEIFADVAPRIAAADIAICHLETPVGLASGPFSGYPQFSVPPQIVTSLRRSGFDSCSTASNHTLDVGETGVRRTLEALDGAGLRHAGSHRSAAEQQTPTVLDTNGVKVAHLSYTFGFNGLSRPAGKEWIANLIDADAILAEARRARSAGAEIVVVSLHWGTEYQHAASTAQIDLARLLTAGPELDLILGSHAHVVQPMEQVNGKWVAYGMGNQIARQSDAYPDRHEGVMPRFTFTELASGHWTVTKVEAVATWIDTTPRIRVVDLADAIADPGTSPDKRTAYLAAHRRITSHLRSRGAQIVLASAPAFSPPPVRLSWNGFGRTSGKPPGGWR